MKRNPYPTGIAEASRGRHCHEVPASPALALGGVQHSWQIAEKTWTASLFCVFKGKRRHSTAPKTMGAPGIGFRRSMQHLEEAAGHLRRPFHAFPCCKKMSGEPRLRRPASAFNPHQQSPGQERQDVEGERKFWEFLLRDGMGIWPGG